MVAEKSRTGLGLALARATNRQSISKVDANVHRAKIHWEDAVDVLHQLVDAGNTVIVIEHNLDVVKTADYIIDLGPEGGDGGGKIVAQGTPEKIAQVDASFTGQFLREVLPTLSPEL